MIRRVSIRWPDERPFRDRDRCPIRLLAASDAREPAMEVEANRVALEPLDGVIGCGDLDPRWLAFLADAFAAPLVYVRGNHDRGGDWDENRPVVPDPLRPGGVTRIAGLALAGLEWPNVDGDGNRRRPDLAWRHALRLAWTSIRRRIGGAGEPLLVISHAPPEGSGDAADVYHRGFPAYRWLLRRLRPVLWLHGHTTTASVQTLETHAGPTTLINVTGAVLIELLPPDVAARGPIP